MAFFGVPATKKALTQNFSVQNPGLGYIVSALVARVLINRSITDVCHNNQCLSATYASDWVAYGYLLGAGVLINISNTDVYRNNQCLSATYASDWVMAIY